MWRSHLHAEPTNAPLFYGPFATDLTLYTERILEGFDAWLGVGQLLVAPQLFEGGLTRTVYFPKSSPDDKSLYFDMHAPYGTHNAGEWATVATPIEHGGLFAREGAVIPIGINKATVTALSGPARTHTDGVDVVLDSDGGQVALDNWRGVMLFPGYGGSDKTYSGEWIEDDGISAEPGTFVIKISYWGGRSSEDAIKVELHMQDNGFTPLWKENGLFIYPPPGDERGIEGAERTIWGEREVWKLKI